MGRAWAVVVAVTLLAGQCWAGTIVVTSEADSGPGTLREAITHANGSSGADLITFHTDLTTRTIIPTTWLPPLIDSGTTVDGDLNDDGAPDILISGEGTASMNGLRIHGHPQLEGCTIRGLALIDFNDYAIKIYKSWNNVVEGCNFGVDRSGTNVRRNADADIKVAESSDNLIGGEGPLTRNVFAVAQEGILMQSSSRIKIWGNYVGIARDGTALASGGWNAVRGYTVRDCRIGGSRSGRRNVFGGLLSGISLYGENSKRNVISGNYFGLAPDGNTTMPIDGTCVQVSSGPHHNTIGGSTRATRNVFGAARVGVLLGERAQSATACEATISAPMPPGQANAH